MKLCFSPPSNTPLRKTTARCEALELADLLARHHSLTPREREVLPLLASGLLNKQVAWELGIVEYTGQIHRGNIMSKIKADFSVVADRTAAEMLVFVGEHGLEGIVASVQIACISRGRDQDYGQSTESAMAKSSWWEATFRAIWVSIPWWWAF